MCSDEFDKYAASLAEIIKISDLPIGLASNVAVVYCLSKGVLLYILYSAEGTKEVKIGTEQGG